MWIAGLAVIAAIAATYHLTRPPELVWWTSPPIDERGHRVNALVPSGWGPGQEPLEGLNLGGASPEFLLVAPVTHLASWMPSWLKDLIMAPEDDGKIEVWLHNTQDFETCPEGTEEVLNGCACLWRHVPNSDLVVIFQYYRWNDMQYRSTHTRICSSLRIE